QEYKKAVLSYLSTLLMMHDTTKSNTTNLSSLLFIKTALRLNYVDLAIIKDNSNNYKFTTETSTKVREAFTMTIWRSCSEVQKNKKKLEKPTFLEEYQTEPKTGIFKYVKEINEVGYQRLFSCYDIGISQLTDILNQEVYKTETKNIKGRHACNVTIYKFESLESTIVKNNDKQEKEILKAILDDDSFSESKALTILH
ncbi:13548_t:CDS:2, partial [Cetraspora pellucida]